MLSVLALLSIPYMTQFSRMAGGGSPKLPLGLDQWLLAAPYLIFYTVIGVWVLPCYFLAVLGLRLGHGRGFHYNLPFEIGSKPERVEILIPDSMPVYWQKFLIMTLTGLAVTLCTALALSAYGYILSACLVGLSGALKAIAYLAPKTEYSEYIRGLFLGLGVALAYFLI